MKQGRPIDPNSRTQQALRWMEDHPSWGVRQTAQKFKLDPSAITHAKNGKHPLKTGKRCPICMQALRSDISIKAVAAFIKANTK